MSLRIRDRLGRSVLLAGILAVGLLWGGRPAQAEPLFIEGPCDQTLQTNAGTVVSFRVKIFDAVQTTSNVTLSVVGLPAGAVMTPPLPTISPGSAASTFDWTPTPSQTGVHTMTFVATNKAGSNTDKCTVIIDVGASGPQDVENYRGGDLQWVVAGQTSGAVRFTLTMNWKRSSLVGQCVDTVGAPTPCSRMDGAPASGDVFTVPTAHGRTVLDFGDGTQSQQLFFLALSTSLTRDNVVGQASVKPRIKSATILHLYPADPVSFVAAVRDSARIPDEGASGLNNHINNPGRGYALESVVNFQNNNDSPAYGGGHLFKLKLGTVNQFALHVSDPDRDLLQWRLATQSEAGDSGFLHPGPPFAPNALTIDPVTGIVTWDTTGATLGAGQFTLYSTQLVVEDVNPKLPFCIDACDVTLEKRLLDCQQNAPDPEACVLEAHAIHGVCVTGCETTLGGAKSSVPIDLLLEMVFVSKTSPVIRVSNGARCRTLLFVDAGDTVTFDVTATDADPGDIVTMEALGLPAGATMTPALPATGNPIVSSFSWTPTAADEGLHVLTFQGTDLAGRQAKSCLVRIEVNIPEIEVPVDIKPTSCRNPLRSVGRGVLPVAILGTAELDVTLIDLTTVVLEGVSPLRSELEDVATPFAPFSGKSDPLDCTTDGPDGFTDLTLKFNRGEVVDAIAPFVDQEVKILRLTGNLFDGTPIVGEDVVVILKKGK